MPTTVRARLASITDEAAEVTTYQYEGERLTTVLKPGGRESHISYSDAGSVRSVTDEQGEGWTFDYGYDSRKGEYYTRIASSSGTVREIWYDEAGDTKRVALDGETVRTIRKDGDALILTDAEGQETRQETQQAYQESHSGRKQEVPGQQIKIKPSGYQGIGCQ